MASKRKITGLPVPSLPKGAPDILGVLLDALENALDDGDAELACQHLQESFDFLVRYFAGMSCAAAGEMGLLTEDLQADWNRARTFDECEALLRDGIMVLGEKANHKLSKAIRKVFFVGSTRKEPTPRRHSRLLQIAGIPIRGYRLLGEFCALESGQGDLKGKGRCSRELRRYLPIFKEWVTASSALFRSIEHRTTSLPEQSRLEMNVTLEGIKLNLGPILTIPDWTADVPTVQAKARPERAEEPEVEEEVPEEEAEEPSEAPAAVVAEEALAEPVAEEKAPEPPPAEEPPAEPVAEEAPKEPVVEDAPAGKAPEELVVEEAPAEKAPEEPVVEEAPAEPVAEEAPQEKAPEEPVGEEPPAEPVAEEPVAEEAPEEKAPEVVAEPVPVVVEKEPPAAEPVAEEVPADAELSSLGPIAPDAEPPAPVNEALSRLNGALAEADELECLSALQQVLDLLSQLLAGQAVALARHFDSELVEDDELQSRPGPAQKEILLATSLTLLEEHWEEHDLASLVWSVFYDTAKPPGDPAALYRHSRLLGIEGSPLPGYRGVSELLRGVPGAGWAADPEVCRREVALYVPMLRQWLDNATPLFLECRYEFEPVEGEQALRWKASGGGLDLEGQQPALWLETDPERWKVVRLAPEPERVPDPEAPPVPEGAPEELTRLLQELVRNLERRDYAATQECLRRSFWFLLQYFAGLCAAAWEQSGELSEEAAELFSTSSSLTDRQRLLSLSLDNLDPESEIGAALRAVFPEGAPHSRLLADAGLVAWSACQPGEGPLETEEACRQELITHVPVLAHWLGAAAAWFGSSEQLFEPPADGRLEGAVVYEDNVLELVEPEYSIRLPVNLKDPFWTQDAPREEELPRAPEPEEPPVEAELPPLSLTVPQGLPRVLEGHLKRLGDHLDEPPTAGALLGAAFEYLIQYFAGVAAVGALESLEPSLREYRTPTSSLRQREKLLLGALQKLSGGGEEVGEAVRGIFYDKSEPRLHTRLLGGVQPLEPGEQLLSYWCRLRQQRRAPSETELRHYVTVLNSWTSAASAYFAECEHFAEEPNATGEEEIVVVFRDQYVELVDPDYTIRVPAQGYQAVLYKEPDHEAREEARQFQPEQPEEVALVGAAGDQEETEIFGGPAPIDAEDDVFAGAAASPLDDDIFTTAPPPVEDKEKAEPPRPTPVSPRPVEPEPVPEKAPVEAGGIALAEPPPPASAGIPLAAPVEFGEKLAEGSGATVELGAAILELYKKEEDDRKAAIKAEQKEAPPVLQQTIAYRGLKTNPVTGVVSHAGTLHLINGGGGELKGTVRATHPCIRVQPGAFKGNENKILYFVDPSDIPSTGRAGILIQTQNDNREIPLSQLIPRSPFARWPAIAVASVMVTPALLGFLWMLVFFYLKYQPEVGRLVERMARGTNTNAIDDVILKLDPMLTAWGLVLFSIATLVPLAVAKFFRRLSAEQQRTMGWLCPLAMVLPSVLLLLAWVTPVFSADFLTAPAYPRLVLLDMKVQSIYFFFLNFAASCYLFLSVLGKIDQWVKDPMRRLVLPWALAGVNLIVILVIVWFVN